MHSFVRGKILVEEGLTLRLANIWRNLWKSSKKNKTTDYDRKNSKSNLKTVRKLSLSTASISLVP